MNTDPFPKITARHIARCLENVERENVSQAAKESIRREMHFLSNDLKRITQHGAQSNEKYKVK